MRILSPLPVTKALHYVNVVHSGYMAFMSDDGFVFRSDAVYPVDGAADITDRVVEDFEVFPVVDGCVCAKALRAHMGY